jgi:DNA replication protein DnaC
MPPHRPAPSPVLTAPDVVETLYRALADNSVGKTIDTLLRNDLLILDEVGFAPLDDTGTQPLTTRGGDF